MTTMCRDSSARRGAASSLVALALLYAGVAGADECTQMRPTDPNGFGGFSYGNAAIMSYATLEGHVRVVYAMTGPHAPTNPNAPAIVGAAAEAALTGFSSMGFSPPLGDDAYPPCASNGGDGRLDVYLVHIQGGDGAAVAEQCDETGVTSHCSGLETTMLIGKKAPDFTCAAVSPDGALIDEFRFSEAIASKYGLLFFYPLDFTFVCPSDAMSTRSSGSWMRFNFTRLTAKSALLAGAKATRA